VKVYCTVHPADRELDFLRVRLGRKLKQRMKRMCLSEAALKNNANIWSHKQADCKLWSVSEEAQGSKLTSLQSSDTVGEKNNLQLSRL